MLERFKALFAGREDAYGQYPRPEEALAGEKRLAVGRFTAIAGKDSHEALSDKQWQAHLEGVMGLGIVPVRKDGTVSWFVFDVDKYAVGQELHQKLERRIQKVGLPMIVTRSKSGGAHVWCFLKAPMPALEAIRIMREWKPKLGFEVNDRKVEMFPKQASVENMDVGSWINLPYFGGREPYDNRIAIGPRGKPLTIEEFLSWAESCAIHPADLGRVGETEASEDGEAVTTGVLEHAPPCVQKMMAMQLGDGDGRNGALFHMGVFYQKSDPDNWQERVHEANRQLCSPPLDYREMGQLINSLSRLFQRAGYKCDDQPMASLCDRRTCMARRFGIGGMGGDLPGLEKEIEKLEFVEDDEPYWIVYSRWGQAITMSTKELMEKQTFKVRYATFTQHIPPIPGKSFDWEAWIGPKMVDAKKVSPPEAFQDSTRVTDLFRDWCAKFCPTSWEMDRLIDGNPVYIADEAAIYFKIGPLQQLMNRNGIKLATKQLWPIIENILGAKPVDLDIGKHSVKAFRVECEVPWFETSIEGMGSENDSF